VLGPSRTFAAPILGTVGEVSAEDVKDSGGTLEAGDTIGKNGLEYRYDARLRGTPGLAVHAVKRGEAAISPDLLGHLMRGLRREPGGGGLSPTGALTVSELKVLRLVAEGRTDKQISATLYISPRTVQSHLAHIRAKTGISRRTQLACWATEHAVT